MKTHLRGQFITFEEKEQNPYLKKYEDYHSSCGYLFERKENKTSHTTDLEKVTCKNCLKISNN